MERRRPVIGITSYGRDEKRRFRISVDYVDAVRRAGGLPLVLPPGERGLPQLAELLDGLILSGGGDVAPELYDGSGHETVYNVDPERDATEQWWVRHVVNSGLPALCICRGAQVLNVTLGGTLVAHVPAAFGDQVAHRAPDPESDVGTRSVRHPVRLEAGTMVRAIIDDPEPSPASWHHQAAERVAPGLQVTARAPDGVVEAVEMRDHPFLLGVQWHPEITAGEDPSQQRLFEALTAAAGQALASRR